MTYEIWKSFGLIKMHWTLCGRQFHSLKTSCGFIPVNLREKVSWRKGTWFWTMCAAHEVPRKTAILKPSKYLIWGEASEAFPSAKGLAAVAMEKLVLVSAVWPTLQALQEAGSGSGRSLNLSELGERCWFWWVLICLFLVSHTVKCLPFWLFTIF